MDREHWCNLYRIDYTITYLLPKEKRFDLYRYAAAGHVTNLQKTEHIYYLNLRTHYSKLSNKRIAYINMTKEELFESLDPKIIEILKDPTYDLKPWED